MPSLVWNRVRDVNQDNVARCGNRSWRVSKPGDGASLWRDIDGQDWYRFAIRHTIDSFCRHQSSYLVLVSCPSGLGLETDQSGNWVNKGRKKESDKEGIRGKTLGSYRRLSEIDPLRCNKVELVMKGEFKRVMPAGLLSGNVLLFGGAIWASR